jgi:predicted regulator of Ras-like GTPase activity (Roadblock/LC7/MglB family)
MSTFAAILKSLVDRVPGAIGAIFADWEGEAVDQFAHVPQLDIQLAGAHWGIVRQLACEHLRAVGAGDVEEMWIDCDGGMVLLRRVTDRYYVVLTTRQGVHLGTARRELERTQQTLLGEM